MYDRFYTELEKAIANAGSIRKLAKEIGYSATYINKIYLKKEKPSEGFLSVLGFIKVCKIKKGK